MDCLVTVRGRETALIRQVVTNVGTVLRQPRQTGNVDAVMLLVENDGVFAVVRGDSSVIGKVCKGLLLASRDARAPNRRWPVAGSQGRGR